MKILHSLALFCWFVGCSANTPIARINDVSVPKELNSGYRVVAVDGAEAARASSHFVTLVPEVELSAGPHTIDTIPCILTICGRLRKLRTNLFCSFVQVRLPELAFVFTSRAIEFST